MIETTYKYEPKIAAIHKARVNVKSLTNEARLIRHEERRCGPVYRCELSAHRRGRVREEARYAHLVLAFFRGRSYRSVENKAAVLPDAKRLHEKAKRHLYSVKDTDIREWLK